ncbi:MAG: DUF2877 domain-containing protein [Clostridiales bacterium]|nr:DUF2877 domain-containing protein [Clostridiales bacterium]
MTEQARKICKRLHRYMLLGPARGRVHSVFNHAVNLQLPFGLMSVLTGGNCLRPFSCTVSGLKPFPQIPITEGMEVQISGETISIPAADFHVSVSQAVDYDLAVDAMANLFVPIDIQLRLRHLLGVIESHADPEDLSSLVLPDTKHNAYAELLAPRLPTLKAALEEEDVLACLNTAREISGCGVGLTPSSDDLLAGYMAGYAALFYAFGRLPARVLPLTRALAQGAAKHTTDLSAAFLLQGGEGLVSEDMIQLLFSLFSDVSHPTLTANAARVAAVGATSGNDTLAGLVLAITHHYGGKQFD